VLDLPVDIFDWLPAIEMAQAEAEAMEQRKNDAQNRTARRR
jgi:hypothetical protein